MYCGVDKTTGERCAVKVVAKKSLSKAKIAEVRREGRVMRELQALPHPNLVRMKDGFEDRRNIYIIMELCGRARARCWSQATASLTPGAAGGRGGPSCSAPQHGRRRAL